MMLLFVLRCLKIPKKVAELKINGMYFQEILVKSTRPRPADPLNLYYQGLDETIYGVQDFAEQLSRQLIVDGPNAKKACEVYGQTLSDFDGIFKLRYRDYESIFGTGTGIDNKLRWGVPITLFIKKCEEREYTFTSLLEPIEIDSKYYADIKNTSAFQDKPNMDAWKSRACTRMSKTVAEEIGNAK